MILSNKNLQHIINESGTGTKISIYIPTHPVSSSSTRTADIIRFKNALQIIKANEKYNERELGATMKKLEILIEDSKFWIHRTLGLAVFADASGYETIDLNYEITDMQYIQDDYVVSPLAIMLSIGTGYYVLDINHTRPRLLHFTSYSKNEVELNDMPVSFEDTINRDEYQQHIQHQSALQNMFHGQSESGVLDADTLRYYKLIAGAVDECLIDHDEPLLLTGTDSRIGNMRPLFAYHNVMKESVVGNNEDLNEQQLQNLTDEVIKNADILKRSEIVEKVKNTPLSKLAVGQTEIMADVEVNNIETLFLSAFRLTTDNVRNSDQISVVLQLPEDISPIETLVRGVLGRGGKVIAVRQDSFEDNEPRALCRF